MSESRPRPRSRSEAAVSTLRANGNKAEPSYAQGVRNALEKMSADSGNLADVITLSFEEPDVRPAQPNTAS